MTVCISAVCTKDQAIVMASDQMLSMGGYMSADGCTTKVDPFYYHWFSQFSADDVSAITPIYDNIRDYDESNPAGRVVDVASIAKDSYKKQRLLQIEDDILASYGLTWEQFKSEGRTRLGDRDFEIVIEAIRRYDLQVEMLVAGFDGQNEPHIFTVGNPGKVDYYDKVGFWAIGSGRHQALASLFASQYRLNAPLEECVAHVLCAKFSAESAQGVGEKTFLIVYTKEDLLIGVSTDVEDAVKRGWKRLPKIPSRLLPKIRQSLDESGDRMRKQSADRARRSKQLDSEMSEDQRSPYDATYPQTGLNSPGD